MWHNLDKILMYEFHQHKGARVSESLKNLQRKSEALCKAYEWKEMGSMLLHSTRIQTTTNEQKYQKKILIQFLYSSMKPGFSNEDHDNWLPISAVLVLFHIKSYSIQPTE